MSLDPETLSTRCPLVRFTPVQQICRVRTMATIASLGERKHDRAEGFIANGLGCELLSRSLDPKREPGSKNESVAVES